MNKQQFKALALSEHGENLKNYIKELIRDMTDVRNIDEINEIKIAGVKKAAEILEDYLLEPLQLNSKEQRIDKPSSEFE